MPAIVKSAERNFNFSVVKRLILILISALILLPLKAQDTSFKLVPESPSVIGRISLISPRLLAEISPSDLFTFSVGFWLKTSIWTTNEYDQRIYNPTFSPSFTLEPRFYFNLADRQEKGKRTDYYSGWFVGLPFAIQFPDLKYSMGAAIGFQCTFGKRWYWNVSLGPGFSYYDARFHATGAGGISLGIILNQME